MSSEVKANKISPATGTTTTLGDASDVFQLPASAEIDIASGATLDVNGTIDATGATVTGFSKAKVGSFTKDISDSTASQAITGVGFTPVAVWLQSAGSSTAEIFSFGWGTSSSQTEGISSGVASTHTVFTRATNRIIRIYNTLASNAYRQCYVASFDSDGFTLTWDAKSGSPTGTISINYCVIG
jgi:hypothetical protein